MRRNRRDIAELAAVIVLSLGSKNDSTQQQCKCLLNLDVP